MGIRGSVGRFGSDFYVTSHGARGRGALRTSLLLTKVARLIAILITSGVRRCRCVQDLGPLVT